jgi:hypothetical protein
MSTATRETSSRATGNTTTNAPRLASTVRELTAAIGVNNQTTLHMIHSDQTGHVKDSGERRIPNQKTKRPLTAAPQGTQTDHGSNAPANRATDAVRPRESPVNAREVHRSSQAR